MKVTVAGAGPAGSSAAIAAARAGAAVTLVDRSRFPRHKVCGEFLSPELLRPAERLGILSGIEAAKPAHIERLRLRFPSFEKNAKLPEPALGLSRYALDQIMLDEAHRCGVVVDRGIADPAARPLVMATGRAASAARGNRIFGFKAHYTGPATDAIELFFFDGAYVGVNCIEGERTNVCGLAPESRLAEIGFDYEELIRGFQPLRERMGPLNRVMDWISTGPLVFGNRLREPIDPQVYPAGDALSFIDPFTGTGIAAAIIAGAMAGACVVAETPVEEYLAKARRALGSPYSAAAVFRSALGTRWAEAAVLLIPASWLVRLTRPKSAA